MEGGLMEPPIPIIASKEGRHYVHVQCWMIIDTGTYPPQLIQNAVHDLFDDMEAGERYIEVDVHGPVEINANGFAVPWVSQPRTQH
jgi:hypothetical protein